MLLQTSVRGVIDTVLADLLAGFIASLPAVIGGILIFLVLATAASVGLRLFRRTFRRVTPGADPVYRQFIGRVVAIVVWFGVGLTALTASGLGELAAALGTSTGFLALGVAYALSGMLADAVAGVYLLRDPDFNPGDEVEIGDMNGTISSIEVRKTRFAVGGDTVVRSNAEIEKRWTKMGETPAD